jgi:erythronate-4-phosphate dehydrogenase
MQPGQLLINAARGGLINSSALQILADRGVQLVMDTWPGEPDIEARQLEAVALATPHIAGYSLTAKQRATDDVIALLIGGKSMPRVAQVIDNADRGWAIDIADWLKGVLIEHYNPSVDDAALRAVASPSIPSENFERLRRTYVLRGELAGSRLRYRHRVDSSMKRAAAALGFEFDKERAQ